MFGWQADRRNNALRSASFKQAVYCIPGASRATQGASEPCAKGSRCLRDEPIPKNGGDPHFAARD